MTFIWRYSYTGPPLFTMAFHRASSWWEENWELRSPPLPKKLPPLPCQNQLVIKKINIAKTKNRNYNKRHKTKDLSKLQPGETVYIRDRQQEAEVIKRSQEPRSYLLKTSDGTVFRRNRSAIVPTGYHDNHGEKQQMTELNTGERQNTPVIPPKSPQKDCNPWMPQEDTSSKTCQSS